MKTTAFKIGWVLAGLGFALTAGATTWTYTPYEKKDGYGVIGTITDGQWTLEVTGFDKMKGILELASWKSLIKGWSEPTDSALRGVLDLRSPLEISDADGTKTAILKVVAGKQAFSYSSDLVAFYCDMLSFKEENDSQSQFAGNENLERIEIGGAADRLPGLLLNRNPKLKAVKLDFPALRSLDGQSIFGTQTNPDPIDVATIAVPSVTNLSNYALNRKFIFGDLVLTNIVSMGMGAFSDASLTNVFLAGPLTNLNATVFKGSSTITNVVLDLPKLAEVSYKAFYEQKNIRRVELVSKLADMSQVTNIYAANIIAGLGDNGYLSNGKWEPNSLRIYISKKQWTPSAEETYSEANPAGFFLGAATFTDKEKQMIAADPTLKGAFGVCVRVHNDKLVRRAFFVHKPSVHDPQGFALHFR